MSQYGVIIFLQHSTVSKQHECQTWRQYTILRWQPPVYFLCNFSSHLIRFWTTSCTGNGFLRTKVTCKIQYNSTLIKFINMFICMLLCPVHLYYVTLAGITCHSFMKIVNPVPAYRVLYCIGTYITVLLKMNEIQSFKIHLFMKPDILEPSLVGSFWAAVLDDDPGVLNANNECKIVVCDEGTQTVFILFPWILS